MQIYLSVVGGGQSVNGAENSRAQGPRSKAFGNVAEAGVRESEERKFN